jgi:hypothetical protein
MRNGCLATLAAVVDQCADLKPNRCVAILSFDTNAGPCPPVG